MTLSDYKALHAYNMRRKPRMTDDRATELSARDFVIAFFLAVVLWLLW
jgi:hypothetical protein